MSEPLLPAGQAVEVEFQRPDKPPQRGVLPQPVDYEATGFELIEVRVPTNLSFREPFRVELQRKWIALATVAEIRFLSEGALEHELDRLRELHEQVQRRIEP